MNLKKCWISHEEQSCERCLACGKKINPSWLEKVQEQVKQVPQETKQKMLDLFRQGKTIGEAREICGLDLHVAAEIIRENIETKSFSYLRVDAV